MSTIQNLNTTQEQSGDNDTQEEGLVHIRLQQRSSRRMITIVQGLSEIFDLKKIVRACRKEFLCDGTVTDEPQQGQLIKLKGDQRENICQWLIDTEICKPEQLKLH
ncbi:eukaryotic translation initiation factor eIF1-like [Drosophila subobscura]|uniref:eukaryotic translation initiation factor eIF1-like n=1 Tax=Drosophila subobscura TaxID=7241 RepID=UPI00155B2F2B|nr:eukaryotic translation initiation factor eIF1-like [Drosophila subobscura]